MLGMLLLLLLLLLLHPVIMIWRNDRGTLKRPLWLRTTTGGVDGRRGWWLWSHERDWDLGWDCGSGGIGNSITRIWSGLVEGHQEHVPPAWRAGWRNATATVFLKAGSLLFTIRKRTAPRHSCSVDHGTHLEGFRRERTHLERPRREPWRQRWREECCTTWNTTGNRHLYPCKVRGIEVGLMMMTAHHNMVLGKSLLLLLLLLKRGLFLLSCCPSC